MHVFYYGNAMVDKNSLGWKSNGFQWKKEKNRREGQGLQLNVIDNIKKFKLASLFFIHCITMSSLSFLSLLSSIKLQSTPQKSQGLLLENMKIVFY